jgi:hypothetical protein
VREVGDEPRSAPLHDPATYQGSIDVDRVLAWVASQHFATETVEYFRSPDR